MSLKIKVYNKKAEAVKDLELSAKVFGLEASQELLAQALVAQQANTRQVLAHTKDRSEVSGGGKKPWKQKGTGRARVGSSRSPIWIGGGVTFGPSKDRNFKKKINQKMKQKALLMVLSDKFASQTLVVIEDLNYNEYKTKDFASLLSNLEKKVLKNERRNILIINKSLNTKPEKNFSTQKALYSSRNLPGVKMINLENINLVDLLNYKNLLLTEEAVKGLEKKYLKQ